MQMRASGSWQRRGQWGIHIPFPYFCDKYKLSLFCLLTSFQKGRLSAAFSPGLTGGAEEMIPLFRIWKALTQKLKHFSDNYKPGPGATETPDGWSSVLEGGIWVICPRLWALWRPWLCPDVFLMVNCWIEDKHSVTSRQLLRASLNVHFYPCNPLYPMPTYTYIIPCTHVTPIPT